MQLPVMDGADLQALWLSLQLAGTTTAILLLISTPIAWWLAFSGSRWSVLGESISALPLMLPPSVLGFYLLLLLSPESSVGKLLHSLGLGQLSFSFGGLVIGSVIYSLPFVVQPLKQAFLSIGARPLEVAATLGAGRWDKFFSVVLPLSKRGYFAAAAMGFAHTLGEFGVVLMIGGNIPGQTRVASMVIYDHVETQQYAQAHWLAGTLVLICFALLWLVYRANRPQDGEPR